MEFSILEHFEMMEMDSPFLPQYGAAIDGKSLNTLKRGQTITLICNINIDIQKENSEDFRRIEWVKDGEVVNLKVNIDSRKYIVTLEKVIIFVYFSRLKIFSPFQI